MVGTGRRTLGPELDGSQGVFEDFLLRYKLEDLVRHSCAIQTPQVSFFYPAKHALVLESQVDGNLRHSETSKDEIYADSRIFELDDGHKGIWHGSELFNRAGWRHLTE